MNRLKKLTPLKRNVLLIIGVIILILTVMLTYAFLNASSAAPGKTQIDVSGMGQESLLFETTGDININATPENFGVGDGNLSGTSTLTAASRTTKANNVWSPTYNVFFLIEDNTYEYSSGSTPELILTINGPSGEVKNVDGLTYTTQGSVSGFDITTQKGLIFNLKDIDITNSDYDNPTVHEWTFTVTLIAHSFDQSKNEGKDLNVKVYATTDDLPHLKVNASYNDAPNSAPVYGEVVSTDCLNGTWNYKYQRLEIEDFKPYSSCNIEYTDTTVTQTLSDYITSLSGNGEVFNENGYRYEGKSPNNWIWFNNESWRVIGVFDDASHGVTGENLVKIIREDPIGGLAWDSGDVNDWNESTLKALLNGAYLNAENGTDSGYCWGYGTTAEANCDYREVGIKDSYRPMIQETTWHLGGFASAGTASATYTAERGTTVYSGRPTEGTGYIGLMYLSDYGYSVKADTCARTTTIYNYDSNTCAGASWLYGKGYERTITPYSSSSTDAWYVDNDGDAFSLNSRYGVVARPTLYLKTDVVILDGMGSEADPFIVAS